MTTSSLAVSSRVKDRIEKRCFRCGLVKPLSEFNRNRSRVDGHQPDCQPCRRAAEKGRKRRQFTVPPDLKGKVTRDHFDALMREQGGVCAICGDACRLGRRLAIDHCHTTGEVRGLLCSQCNSGIGLLGDRRDLLLAAADYLARPPIDLSALIEAESDES